MTFKEKLVKLRKLKGLTQDEFASAVGVSRQAVYKWESGQSYPEVPKLLEIKLLFGISIDDLLDEAYEVVLPEKKKRRRISEEAKRRIEAEVRREEGAPVTAAKEETAEPVAVEAATVAEPATEPVAVDAEPATEPAPAEEPAVVEATSEETVVAPADETAAPAAPEKKKGLFARIFGKK